MGYRESAGGWEQIVVEHVIGPGPRAKHERARFEPDGRWQQDELARLFYDSEGRSTYLGDWHSHPSGGRLPSARDLKTARSISRRRSSRTKTPLMVIVAGGVHRSWSIAPTRFYDGVLDPIELERHD